MSAAEDGGHAPVMLVPAIAALAIRAEGCYVDATFGRGGHSAAILERLGPTGTLLAIDRDPQAVARGRERFGGDPRFAIEHAPFSRLASVIAARGLMARVDGLLLDLGVSSPQLDEAARGFSFLRDGPLDMRMDPTRGESAAQWLARAGEREIADVIFQHGEDRFGRRIARAIVAARESQPIATTRELATVIAAAVPTREPGKHPATRAFQAIRIHVNDELGELDAVLAQSLDVLAAGGRLAVISFHSLEDRRVKRFLKLNSQPDPVWAGLPDMPASARPKLALVGKATFPDDAEVAANPRARSAVLRVAERLAA